MNFQLVNDYLTSIFNNVLVIEESSLRSSRFNDVSIKEMHTIDVIGTTPNATPSDISRELMVTLGTVTTSLNNLELLAMPMLLKKRQPLIWFTSCP